MISVTGRPYDVITFDCYGTLIDWEGGVGSFLYDLALRNRDDAAGNGRALRERWETIQFDVIQGDYRRYRDVLAESLRLLCAERDAPRQPIGVPRLIVIPDGPARKARFRDAGKQMAGR